MKLGHKVAIIALNVLGPGFAQALFGRRRAALVWFVLALVPTLLATFWVLFPLLGGLMRLAAGIGAALEMRRRDDPPAWWWNKLTTPIVVIGLASFGFMRASVDSRRIPTSSMYPTIEIGDYVFVDKLSLAWKAPERGEILLFEYPCDPMRDFIKRVIAVGGDTVEVRCGVVYVNGTPVPNTLVEAKATYRDLDDRDRRWFTRPVSRYRETHGGHTYEVFHDAERPGREPATATEGDVRDFPQRDRMFAPSCQQGGFYPQESRIQQLAGELVITKPDAKACEPQAHFVVPRGGLFMMGDNRNIANDSRVWGVVPIEAVRGRLMGVWMTKAPGDSGSLRRFGAIE